MHKMALKIMNSKYKRTRMDSSLIVKKLHNLAKAP